MQELALPVPFIHHNPSAICSHQRGGERTTGPWDNPTGTRFCSQAQPPARRRAIFVTVRPRPERTRSRLPTRLRHSARQMCLARRCQRIPLQRVSATGLGWSPPSKTRCSGTVGLASPDACPGSPATGRLVPSHRHTPPSPSGGAGRPDERLFCGPAGRLRRTGAGPQSLRLSPVFTVRCRWRARASAQATTRTRV